MSRAGERVCIVGAGRMGEGMAAAFLHAGLAVTLIDFKARDAALRDGYFAQVRAHVELELQMLVNLEVITSAQVDTAMARLRVCGREAASADLATAPWVFEAVPEVMDTKAACFAWLGAQCSASAVIASTTSTFLVTELAELVPGPQRFINAHWLNPALLMPLVEVSRSTTTDEGVVQGLMQLLRDVGKVPVQCGPAAGYIVPRIQALAMNEAARMVEEGVASAEDIDTAIRVGFGLRFSVLGLLEFIDWGGGDILHFASRYLATAIDPRFAAPRIIGENMAAGRNGMRDGQGFYDYRDCDVAAYRLRRLGELKSRLQLMGMLPAADCAIRG
jgi:3-hydroxybutyryl-CoA dehydrogenase